MQKQEHLIKEDVIFENVEKVFDWITDAREALFKLDLKRARQIYTEIITAYNKLNPAEQRIVYKEVKDLYEERKKAERLFMH